ncbi:MAG: universal stress protein [Salinibacter sp.]|uniref:universal stress protein n=1 Tax=Salinibacter sp. TaxID=2065818 RepID=UPI0035D4F1C5
MPAGVHTRPGDTSLASPEFVEWEDIDSVVIPTRGRTGRTRFFPGRGAEKTGRYVDRPVLTVRASGGRSCHTKLRESV